jgi:hypothetical protein
MNPEIKIESPSDGMLNIRTGDLPAIREVSRKLECTGNNPFEVINTVMYLRDQNCLDATQSFFETTVKEDDLSLSLAFISWNTMKSQAIDFRANMESHPMLRKIDHMFYLKDLYDFIRIKLIACTEENERNAFIKVLQNISVKAESQYDESPKSRGSEQKSWKIKSGSDLPESLAITLEVFPSMHLTLKYELEYEMRDGKLVFWFVLLNAHEVVKLLHDTVKLINNGVQLTTYPVFTKVSR